MKMSLIEIVVSSVVAAAFCFSKAEVTASLGDNLAVID